MFLRKNPAVAAGKNYSQNFFISTSAGVFRCELSTGSIQKVLSLHSFRNAWEPRSLGFSGMCYSFDDTPSYFVASKERSGLKRFTKKATASKIFRFSETGLIVDCLKIPAILDIHQIGFHDGLLFLTDTGKNAIQIWSFREREKVGIIKFGQDRVDLNHINAVGHLDHGILVGHNNRGCSPGLIYYLPYERILGSSSFEIDGFHNAEIIKTSTLFHTHDLIGVDGRLCVCSSSEGALVDAVSGGKLIQLNGWVRGLAQVTDDLLAVGISPIGSRRKRHSLRLDGSVYLVSISKWCIVEHVVLQGSGQISDLRNNRPRFEVGTHYADHSRLSR